MMSGTHEHDGREALPQVPDESAGRAEYDLSDLRDSMVLESLAAPEDLGGDDVEVGAGVMIRLVIDGRVVEYLECSRRTDKDLFLADETGVWVRWRVTDTMPVVQRVLIAMMAVLAIPAAGVVAMAAIGADWLGLAAGGVLGLLLALAAMGAVLPRLAAARVAWGAWAPISPEKWATVLDRVRVHMEEGRAPLFIGSMVDFMVFGEPPPTSG